MIKTSKLNINLLTCLDKVSFPLRNLIKIVGPLSLSDRVSVTPPARPGLSHISHLAACDTLTPGPS